MTATYRLRCALAVAVVALSCALALPSLAFGLDVTATTARSNSDSGNEIMGGTETRVTWEGQAAPNESIAQIVLDYPAGSTVPASGVKVTGLAGLTRISLDESVSAIDDDTIAIDFSTPTDTGLLIRVEASKVLLPADGGDLTVSGSLTLADGSSQVIGAGPAIHVVSVTPSEQLSSWLSGQGWVQAWNSNSFLHMFLDPSIVATSLPEVFFGWLQALGMVICSFPFAIVVGLLLCFLRISPWRVLRAIGALYVNVVRGTPLFLQIYIAFFGLPLMGVKPPDFLLAVVVMFMNSAAYLCEIFRAGIESIHKGQFEASRSLGMNAVQTMFFVIIPQAVRRVIPTMTSEFILLYKDTSLFASVGVLEIIMHAKSLTATTGNMTPYIVAAFFYLLVTLPLTKFVGNLEKRMDDPSHGRKRKGAVSGADDAKDEQAGGAKHRPNNFKGEPCIIDGKYRRVRIERIHLEEDVGKSLHLQGAHSYIDYNRSGTPLIEIVTKPDMSSPDEAALFMQTVQEILRYVKVTAGNLEEGNMRCDANINLNVWEDGKLYHTPISEIKNLNSFKAIREACTYEAKRQLEEFQNDRQEFNAGFKVTMGWDEAKGQTVVQRTKNSFVDYRFVVEPDIKPFSVSDELISRAGGRVGELPEAKRVRLKKDYGLSDFDVETLTSTRELSLWFEEAAKGAKNVKKVANWILAELLAVLNEKNITISEVNITPAHITELVNAIADKKITSAQGKTVFAKMLESGKMPADIIKSEGMESVTDMGAIEAIVDQVIADNPKAVADFKSGKTNVVGWLMGQVMKASKGKANPGVATKLLDEKMAKL